MIWKQFTHLEHFPPKLKSRFNSFLTTEFDDSISVEMQLRTVIKWCQGNFKTVDTLIDFINDISNWLKQFENNFDTKLEDSVISVLTEWQVSGKLDVVISEALQWQLDDYIATNEQDKLSLTAQLQQIAVDVKTFGAKGDGITDDTDAFNLAIANTPTGGVLMVTEGTYMIDGDDNIGISINKPMTLSFNNGAILKKIPTNVGEYTIIHIKNTEKVTIEGQGVLIGDRNEHIGTTGEWGTGIKVLESKDIIIRDMTLKDFWGDGIYVYGPSSSTGPYGGYSLNILIDNVTIDNVRRNGIGILDCIGVTVRNSRITNTKGTMPQAGIDIEPNYRQANNIVIENCYFSGNEIQDIVGGGGYGVGTVKVVNCSFVSKRLSLNFNGSVAPIKELAIVNNDFNTESHLMGFSNIERLTVQGASVSTKYSETGNNRYIAFAIAGNVKNASFSDVKGLDNFFIIFDIVNDSRDSNILFEKSHIKNVEFNVIRGYNQPRFIIKDIFVENANSFTLATENSEFYNNTMNNSNISLYRTRNIHVANNLFYSDSSTLQNFIRGNFLDNSEITSNTFKYSGSNLSFLAIQAPENSYTDSSGIIVTREKPNLIMNNAALFKENPFLLNSLDISQGNIVKTP